MLCLYELDLWQLLLKIYLSLQALSGSHENMAALCVFHQLPGSPRP